MCGIAAGLLGLPYLFLKPDSWPDWPHWVISCVFGLWFCHDLNLELANDRLRMERLALAKHEMETKLRIEAEKGTQKI